MGRREENNRRTKAAIVDNALRLFNERGYDEVTVEEITRAAGVAKGTFYSYFAVKSDIIVEEFWKIDRYYAEYASRNLRRYAGAEEKLRAFTRAQMRYVRDEVGNDSLKVLYVNQTIQRGGDKVIVNPDRQWYRIVSGVIAQGQETGVFRADVDAATLAYDFNRSMRSVFLDWCITDAAFDLVREGLAYLDTWLLPA
ncbi:MAG: TetR/AcrR family transcriptional regulator, partial [bacterium]